MRAARVVEQQPYVRFPCFPGHFSTRHTSSRSLHSKNTQCSETLGVLHESVPCTFPFPLPRWCTWITVISPGMDGHFPCNAPLKPTAHRMGRRMHSTAASHLHEELMRGHRRARSLLQHSAGSRPAPSGQADRGQFSPFIHSPGCNRALPHLLHGRRDRRLYSCIFAVNTCRTRGSYQAFQVVRSLHGGAAVAGARPMPVPMIGAALPQPYKLLLLEGRVTAISQACLFPAIAHRAVIRATSARPSHHLLLHTRI